VADNSTNPTAEAWYARGPQGQVRWTLGSDGSLDAAYTYNAWGALSGKQLLSPTEIWPPRTLPIYLDNDQRLLGSGQGVDPQSTDNGYPTWKQGPGVAADATPLVGPLASPAASGGAGQGASGNPLTPAASGSTNLSDGNPWKFDPDDPYGVKHWIDGENWARNGGQWGTLPGAGTDKSPIGAPPAGLDTSSIADNRLASLWSVPGLSGASEYYGVKPGHQTGGSNWDDTRNQRLPLPGVNNAGSPGRMYGPPEILPYIVPDTSFQDLLNQPFVGYTGPQVPNPGSGGQRGGGGTHEDPMHRRLIRAGVLRHRGHPTMTPSATGDPGGGSPSGGGDGGPFNDPDLNDLMDGEGLYTSGNGNVGTWINDTADSVGNFLETNSQIMNSPYGMLWALGAFALALPLAVLGAGASILGGIALAGTIAIGANVMAGAADVIRGGQLSRGLHLNDDQIRTLEITRNVIGISAAVAGLGDMAVSAYDFGGVKRTGVSWTLG
jgi:hypothetical protein